MKKIITLAAIFLFLIQQNILSQGNDSTITGNWESVVENNARGFHLVIKNDSSFILENTLRANYKYRVEGNKLITTLNRTDGKKAIIDTSSLEFKGDTLISIFKRDSTTEITKMVRTDGKPAADSGIVGKWKWRYPNAVMAFSKYTKDGLWLFRLPIAKRTGKCKINSSSIKFIYTLPDEKPDEFTFWVKQNVLILTSPNGAEQMYKRVDY
ncbi:MAG: hypothetical protein ACYC49_05090 [Ignavibacteriaceae bacterium]